MNYATPDTTQKRKAGMAAFRAQMLKAHQQALADAKSPRAKAMQQTMIDTIQSAQRKFGEV